MKKKSDKKPIHGSCVSAEILKKAAQTAFPTPCQTSHLSQEEKIAFIAERFEEIMEALGLDLSDSSLARTPYRVAKMYVNEIFSGLDLSAFPEIRLIEDKFQHKDETNMVFTRVRFNSFCEHHFVPMNGTASIAYAPSGKLIGLSKISRIVHFFARRPQLQERLTAQIADSICTLLGTPNVAVSILAEHHCIIARGVEDEESRVITNVLRGRFDEETSLRREFFEAVSRSCKP